jgi:benzoate-CoA ligase
MVRGEHIEFTVPERFNLGAYYLDVNLDAGRGNKTAIYHKDTTYSFLDLWRLTNRAGNVLKALGVEPENRVLLILEDCPEWAATWLAVMKIGAVGTHAYTYLHPHDYEYLLDLVRPKVVVVDEVTLERVRQAAAGGKHPRTLLVAGDVRDLRAGEFGFRRLLETADDRLEPEPTHPDDTAFWNFSSGTTGKPKGVPHRHHDGAAAFESFNYVLGYDTAISSSGCRNCSSTTPATSVFFPRGAAAPPSFCSRRRPRRLWSSSSSRNIAPPY